MKSGTIIRCEASPLIGLGHLSRCLSLADAIARQGGRVSFAMRRSSPGLSRIPTERGYEVFEIERDPERDLSCKLPAEDARQVVGLAERLAADWIVVDSYDADDRYLERLRGGRSRLLVIDDLADRDLGSADLIVNPTPGASGWYGRSAAGNAKVLGEPEHALVHQAFRKARAQALVERDSRRTARVLICMGGADVAKLSQVALEQIRSVSPDASVRLVVGQAAEMTRALLGVEILRGLSPAEMAESMAWADYAVATPSTIAWELACLGVPAALVRVAANQARVALSLREQSAVAVLETPEGIGPALLQWLGASGEEKRKRTLAWSSLCDGLGADRVADEMENLSRGSTQHA